MPRVHSTTLLLNCLLWVMWTHTVTAERQALSKVTVMECKKVFYIKWITNQWKAEFALLNYNKQRTRQSCLFYYCVCKNKCANTSGWLCRKQQNLTSDLLLFSWHCILFFLELWNMKTALHSTLHFKIAKKNVFELFLCYTTCTTTLYFLSVHQLFGAYTNN